MNFEPEMALRGIVTGIQNALESMRINKVVIGLSGGIDSAVTAALAVRAIGSEKVHGYIMPSEYSAPESAEYAYKLARNLGIEYDTIPIDDALVVLKKSLLESLGQVTGTVTEENLQARIRGVLLMAYANENNAVVVATGNKSEAFVGYCTLYGDTVGAFAPLGHIFKTEVYKIADFLNKDGEHIPQEIIDRAPSAELSPGQKDTDALPPYDILDVILAHYEDEGKQYVLDKHIDDVENVIERIEKNAYKWRQSAPALDYRKYI